MKNVIYLFLRMLTTVAKLLRPGGGRAVIAENLLLKQQLIKYKANKAPIPAMDRAMDRDPTSASTSV